MMRNEAMVVEMSADQREKPAEKRDSANNRQNLRRGNFSADNTIQMSKTSSAPTKTPSYPSLLQGNFCRKFAFFLARRPFNKRK